MFNKKLLIIATLFWVTACATNTNGKSSEEFAMGANVDQGYKETIITGEKIYPINLTEKSELLVSKSEIYTILKYPNDQKNIADSNIMMTLSYMDNYMNYSFININGEIQKIKNRREPIKTCDDICTKTLYFNFNVKTSTLIAAKKTGLIFSINREKDSNDFIFKIPANYISGLLKRKENEFIANNNTISNKTSFSKEIEMVKYWFNEATATEQENFMDWALINRKKITTSLNGKTKTLEMLEYWYKKTQISERNEILSWLLSQNKTL